jgi:hypothetical protein
MKQQLILMILFLGLGQSTQAQKGDSSSSSGASKNFFIGAGGIYTTFQDVKFSNSRYSGAGALLQIGIKKQKNRNYFETALEFSFSTENADTHNEGRAIVINPTLYLKYLKPISNNFLLGGRLDVIDLYYRGVDGLGNNGDTYINGSHLYGSLMYNKTINNKWQLNASIDLGLLSFMKESTSFAFTAPQSALEDGKFSYQDEALESPFGLKYFDLKHIGNNLNLKSSFMLKYKERISFGYSWNMRHFSTVKNYPTTIAKHALIFKYNLNHK